MRRDTKEFLAMVVAPVAVLGGLCGLLIWYWPAYSVVTDHKTGCQYIRTEHGITPRVAADGKAHFGCVGSLHAP